MDIMNIVLSAALIGVIALAVGLLLGVAGKFFHVEVDEREVEESITKRKDPRGRD